VTELAEALAGVCGVGGRLRVATLEEDQVQYVLRPRQSSIDLSAEDIPPPGMSPKTALLAGLVIGVTLMVGVLGFLAWRSSENAATTTPSPSPSIVADDAGAPRDR
jgi:hypothetical protein